MKFEEALFEMKNGLSAYREAWGVNKEDPHILVFVQRPDANSKMTEPYLCMRKSVRKEDKSCEVKHFPLDLSCESIFAEDWVVFK